VRAVTHTVTTTIHDIAHVIPGWVKALMAALGVLLAAAAALILAAAYRNRRLRSQRAALLADVGALQAALLPIVPERVGALNVSVAYRPAEGLAAGGDFYDVFPLDGERVGILVGDVSGHGRESLRAATFTRHMVRAYLEAGLGPRESLQVAGRVVDQHERDEEFATLIAAVHDPTAGTLSYASAGHPPPIVTGPAAHQPMIVASSPPLGVDAETGLRQTTIPLPAGSTVCLFTDGLFEARLGAAMIGRKRVAEILDELEPGAKAEDLVERVAHDTEALHDDVAVCIIRVDGDATTSGMVRVEELEVQATEIDGSRVRRFLEAAGVEPSRLGSIMATARRRAAADGSVVLRVRLARDRSGVDVLPARPEGAAAPVAALSAKRAIER
jgi:serine phosphatase RsbU (regulator of sigma subunit)